MIAAVVQPPRAVFASGLEFDRLPLVVGVTGHRDVAAEDEAPLREAFGRILQDLAAAHPHTPLLVLSGIAAGADTLAAEEAISRGIAVIGCVPLAIDDYEEDFSEDERRRFRDVLTKCARVTRVSKATKREAAYVGVGSYIVHHSHVLVAFWDGGEPGGIGGTADIVYMRTTGLQMQMDGECATAERPNIGPVFRIVTPRLSGERPRDPYAIHREYPSRFYKDADAQRDFHAALGGLDLYNADISRGEAKLKGRSSLRTFMERTDEAANRLQRHVLRFLRLMYVFGFIAAGSQINISAEWVRLGTIGLALVAYYLARRNDFENRYQDYRTLSEGLRVQIAWHAAGLSDELVETHYLKMQSSELQWIRMALRTLYLLYCAEGSETPSHEHPDCREWIEGQCAFYHKAARREARKHLRFSRLQKLALIVAGSLAGLSSVVLYSPLHDAAPIGTLVTQFDELLKNLSTGSIAMGLLVAALLSSYSEKRDFAPNIKRYDRMFHVFDEARRRLEAIKKRGFGEDPRSIVRELGREALVEHADWLLARRDRPLSLPVK